ncbi:HNH endonuclease [Gilliamella sp. Choc5-1]|nr:HNH endonuclease [Gilliamella apicola]
MSKNTENRMQLVPSREHLETGHIGGEALSKGK